MRRVIWLSVFVLVGALYGLAVQLIPGIRGLPGLWVANPAAPWLVLAFLAGWRQGSRTWAPAAGALAAVACLVGRWGHILLLDMSPGSNRPDSPLVSRVAENLPDWLTFVDPLLLIAVVGGAAYGVLGTWWARRRSIVAGIALGSSFLVEPWFWIGYMGHRRPPYLPWAGEIMVGIAVLVWVALARRRATSADDPNPLAVPLTDSR